MATQINNYQIAKLVDANKVLGGAIDITGSADEMTSGLADGDFFLVQDASSGVPQKITAQVMQDYFSLQDVTVASSGTGYRLLFIDSSGEDREIVYVDDATLTFDADNQQLVVHSIQLAGTADLNGSLDFDGSSFDVDASSYFQVDAAAASHVKTTTGALVLSGAAGVTASSALSVSGAAGFDSTLTVTGAVHAKNTLRVDSTADLNGSLDFDGSSFDVDASSYFQVDAQAASHVKTNSGALILSGAAGVTASSALSVSGAAGFDSTLTVTGAVHAKSTLRADAAVDINSTADISDTLTLSKASGTALSISAGNIDAEGAADIADTLTLSKASGNGLVVASNADINGGIDVEGASDIADTLTLSKGSGNGLVVSSGARVDGALDLNGSVDFDGSSFDVDASSYFQVDAQAASHVKTNSGALILSGAAGVTASSALSVSGAAGFDSTLTVTGAVHAKSTLRADGAVDINSTADISDTLTLSKASGTALTISAGAIDAEGTADIADTLTLSKGSGTGLSVTANASIGGNLEITGDLSVNGATTTIDTTNLLVEDPLFVLAKNQTGSALFDQGFIAQRSGSNQAFIWDESDDVFAMVATEEAGSTAGNIAIASYAGVRMGALRADGAIDANSTSDFADTATFSKSSGFGIVVTADADIDGGLDVEGASDIADTLTLSKGSGNGLIVTSGAQVGGALDLNGSVDFDGSSFDVDASSYFQVDAQAASHVKTNSGALVLSGAAGVTASSALSVSGAAGFDSTLTVTGAVHAKSTLRVDSAADLNGSLDFDGSSFDVDASSYFQVDAAAASHVKTTSGALILSGAAGVTASSALSVSGAAGFDSTLTVTGAVHAKSTLRADGSVDINSTADISDTLTLSKASGTGLSVTSDATIGGDITLNGTSADDAALSDLFYFQGGSNVVKKESLADMIDLAKSDGIQISSGLVSIDYVEQLFMSSSLTAGISASLSNEPLADSLHVYLNGLLQLKSGSISGNTNFDYRVDGSGASQVVVMVGGTIDADDVIQIKYIKK